MAPPRRRKPPRAGALTELPPLKILRSIVLLQLAYYGTASVIIVFITLVLGKRLSFDLILDWRVIRGDVTVGWTIGFAWLLTGLFTVIPLLLLVSRSKLVPDFGFTVHGLHLLVTTFYTKAIPTNLLWWALQAASSGLLIGLGIWACRYRELQPISFGGNANANAVKSEEREERRRRGGRNLDGGPSYEMVGMKENEAGDENV